MTPVERVARAIAGYMHPDRIEDYWHNWLEEVQREHFRVQARAAIEALWELPPSITTIDGCDRWTWNCHTCGGPKENWQAFIDAALGEGGE